MQLTRPIRQQSPRRREGSDAVAANANSYAHDSVFVYSQPVTRIRNIGLNPKVTLNFGGDGSGGDIVVLSGTAEVLECGPSAVENTAWAVKCGADWERTGMTAESFAQRSACLCESASEMFTGAEADCRFVAAGAVSTALPLSAWLSEKPLRILVHQLVGGITVARTTRYRRLNGTGTPEWMIVGPFLPPSLQR